MKSRVSASGVYKNLVIDLGETYGSFLLLRGGFIKSYGFTLVELIGTIAIMGLLALAAIPSLRNIMGNNEKKRFDYYSISMENAAKVYYRREKRDIFDNRSSSTAIMSSGITICIDKLIDLDLLSEVGSGYECRGGVNMRYDGKINFYPTFICKEGSFSSGEVVYQSDVSSSIKSVVGNVCGVSFN